MCPFSDQSFFSVLSTLRWLRVVGNKGRGTRGGGPLKTHRLKKNRRNTPMISTNECVRDVFEGFRYGFYSLCESCINTRTCHSCVCETLFRITYFRPIDSETHRRHRVKCHRHSFKHVFLHKITATQVASNKHGGNPIVRKQTRRHFFGIY